jgi:predicted short-subunit dehydrogenase-like oxidoreductase (DUF2520 family)
MSPFLFLFLQFRIFHKKLAVNKYSISFVGAGRVAGIMCRVMYKTGFKIDMIVSKSEIGGTILANDCDAIWSDKPVLPDSTKIIIVAVPDRNVKGVLGKIKCNPKTIVVHTAGSIGIDVFPVSLPRHGVFYPLQTFSPNRIISFSNLPVFIEASDAYSSAVLANIALTLGAKSYFSDAEHRRILHLAAVFVCNFTNHMMARGKELALNAGYSFEDLKPLITETVLKAFETGPENSQTGPAVRNDKNTVKKHLELLSFDRDLQRMYREISGSIYRYHNKS